MADTGFLTKTATPQEGFDPPPKWRVGVKVTNRPQACDLRAAYDQDTAH